MKKEELNEAERSLLKIDNHKLGCMLECYANVLRFRMLEEEALKIEEVASRIK